ncbi:hypothetical protein BKA64DRAFT_636404 [Cadophora sp. MPI-SDFR-AT-0126]|nr:hypothetical protein BKA64DRAFT_636404 [Leotiomycetes sp. MPI-SDFR-AT-0126]
MLPPAPSCRRALQRQLYTPSDSIWVSDEALSHVFQRFCAVSKTKKRYGSFVPGPLESRRRLGKRRMTLQSDAAPTPTFGLASLWGSFGEADRTRWQWEAPTTRDMRPRENSSVLPKWLVEWGTASEAVPDPIAQTRSGSRKKTKDLAFKEEIRSFQKALKECSPGEMAVLCDDFNRKLTQTLSLGLHTENVFSYTTKFVFQDIQRAFLDSEQASARCLALCQAMWDGISNSKVMQPSDIGNITMRRFMAILCDMPMSERLQALASEVLSSASKTQLQEMHSSIARLVHSWLLSLHEGDASHRNESPLALAVQSVFEATNAVASVQTLTESLERSLSFEQDLQAFRQSLQIARNAIASSAGIITEVECIISPHQRSIRTLTSALSRLPPGLLRTIVHQCSSRIPKSFVYNAIDTSLQHRWLSLVAQLPSVSETLLLETWRQFGTYLEQDSATDILLNHWIGRDLFERPALARIVFDAVASQRYRKDYSTLLYVIDGERENCWDKLRLLFRFLDKLGDRETIYRTLTSLHKRRIKVPADVMDETLESIAIENTVLAQKAFRFYRFIRYNDAPLRLEKCPRFIFSMINNPDISTSVIWKSLGIPMYEVISSHSLARHTPPTQTTLTPIVADHFTKMATLFAHCKGRTQRVAFRNVMQCLFHLRRHNAPITPELTRAMVHAGISRKISSDGWIAEERSHWLLELIEQVEGTEVAVTVDQIVKVWNRQISERVSKRDRAMNGI